MGSNQDFRHVYLTEYARQKRLEQERRGNMIVAIVVGLVIGLGVSALSIASGLEDARRIAAERELY